MPTPKLKTHRGTAKRFHKKGGKKKVLFKHRRSHRNHILTKKAKKRKRQLRGPAHIKKMDQLSIKRLLNGS